MKTLSKSIEFWTPTALFKPGTYDVQLEEPERIEDYSENQVRELIEHLCSFIKARKGLHHLRKYQQDNRELLATFCRCNFGMLDNVMDITPDRLNFEYVKCEHKGKNTCPYQGEGVVCIKV